MTAHLPPLAASLLAWWCGDEAARPPFAADLQVLSLSGAHNEAEVWLVKAQPRSRWEAVVVRAHVAESNRFALMFDANEPITEMRVRMSWCVEVRDGSISQVTQAWMRIAPE